MEGHVFCKCMFILTKAVNITIQRRSTIPASIAFKVRFPSKVSRHLHEVDYNLPLLVGEAESRLIVLSLALAC